MWIVVEGGAIPLHLLVRQGGFDTHTRLRDKDLPARISYSSIPKSFDRITWIPGWVEKANYFFPLCMYA